jgi:hypothetical protein
LIGIDEYEVLGNELHGCKNDVGNMRRFLEGLNVTVADPLCDRQAGVSAVLKALHEDVAKLKAREQLIVHFSGHGWVMSFLGQQRGVACPWNFHKNDRNSGIIDLDLEELFTHLNPDARMTIFVDCCFSGALEPRIWVLPGVAWLAGRIARLRAKRASELKPHFRVRRFGQPVLSGLGAPSRTLDDIIGDHDVVVLAASGGKQNSGEDKFGNGIEGVFTHFLLQRLAVAIDEPASDTCKAIINLTGDKYEQVAELHGRHESWKKPLIEH